MRSFYSISEPSLPPRVQAALAYLGHCREKQHTCDPLSPPPGLNPQERAVERHALQVLSLYFTGEMEFVDRPPSRRPPRREDDNADPQRVPV